MVEHEFTHMATAATEATGHQFTGARRPLPPGVVAQQIRSAYARAMAEHANEAAPEALFDQDALADTLKDQYSKEIPELSKPLKDYKESERLEILHAHPATKFIPGVKGELSYAFGLLHGLVRGEDAAKKLDHVAGHAYSHSRKESKDEKVTASETTVVRICQNYAALARNARSNRRRLDGALQAVRFSLDQGERYGDLAEFFAPLDDGAFEGYGQLAHFIDMAMVATGGTGGDTANAFGAKLTKDAQNTSIVLDPFTAKRLTPEIEQRERELLSSIPMESAGRWIGLAMRNEGNREMFWRRRVEEARRLEVATPAAKAALHGLIA